MLAIFYQILKIILISLKSVELVQNYQLVKEAGDRVFIFQHDISSDDPLPRKFLPENAWNSYFEK